MANDIEARALAVFQRLPELVAEDKHLMRRGRYMTVDFMVEIGEVPFLLSISDGRLTEIERGPFLMQPWSFAIRGSVKAWSRFWEPTPKPGWNDLFAMMKRKEMRVEGDLSPFMAHLQYIKDLLAAPRCFLGRMDHGC